MKRAHFYSSDKVERALKNFFDAGNLIALQVNSRFAKFAEKGDRSLGVLTWRLRTSQGNWGVRERMAVCFLQIPAANT